MICLLLMAGGIAGAALPFCLLGELVLPGCFKVVGLLLSRFPLPYLLLLLMSRVPYMLGAVCWIPLMCCTVIEGSGTVECAGIVPNGNPANYWRPAQSAGTPLAVITYSGCRGVYHLLASCGLPMNSVDFSCSAVCWFAVVTALGP